MKISGIYRIQSKSNPLKMYIGSAIDVKHRKVQHLSALRKNEHTNKKLQNHYNKYGESDLCFSILLKCDKLDLIKNEQSFIDVHKPYFNILQKAGSSLGYKTSNKTKKKQSIAKKGKYKGIDHPMFGKHHSKEAKSKIRLKRLGTKQKPESIAKRVIKNSGKKRTEESKTRLSKSHLGLNTWVKGSHPKTKTTPYHLYIKENIKNKTQTEIAKELNISQSTISLILKKWKNQNCSD